MVGFIISILQLYKILMVSLILTILDTLEALFPNVFAPRKTINNQLVVITGSGSGLGRLLAVRLAKMGARLALVDENEASNRETEEMVRALTGAQVQAYTCDLGKRKDIYGVTDAIQSQMGDVDILINNASHYYHKRFMETPDEEINRSTTVNHLALCWTAHAFLPKMIQRNQGQIVTIASAAGIVAVNQLTAYAAAKHAAVGFHRSLSMELDDMGVDNVKLTLICPYYIRSEKTEGLKMKFNWLLPVIEPDEAADKIIDAVLRNRKFLTFPACMNIFIFLQNIVSVNVSHYIARSFGVISSASGSTAKSNAGHQNEN